MADTLPTGLTSIIHKDTLTVPGASSHSKALVERLLEQDRESNHCFYGPGFHDHLSHHLLAAYDLGAPPALIQAIYDDEKHGLLSVFTSDRPNKTVERQNNHIGVDTWTHYLGQEKYYANYLEFFSDEVRRLGPRPAYQHYVFSEDANIGKAHMTERFVGGALHPLIQMGNAIEFGSDAMIAQALAQTAVHEAFEPGLFPWSAESVDDGPAVDVSANGQRAATSKDEHTLLSILRETYRSDIMTPVLPYDPDALLSARRKAAFTPARVAEIRRLTMLWHLSAFATPAQLAQKTEELFFLGVLLFAGVGRPGRKERLDFFLMHVLTSTVFVPNLVGALDGVAAQKRLLEAVLSVVLAYVLLRGRPRIDCELIMSYTASPRPDGAQLIPTPGALGERATKPGEYINPWPTLLAHVLPARDAHTLKALRTLYVGAQRYGTIPVGAVRGAVDGRGEETHAGAKGLDGSVFVRAAGALVRVMGWVGPGEGGGQKEGSWDRSALGWDEAWDGED